MNSGPRWSFLPPTSRPGPTVTQRAVQIPRAPRTTVSGELRVLVQKGALWLNTGSDAVMFMLWRDGNLSQGTTRENTGIMWFKRNVPELKKPREGLQGVQRMVV